jgi:hypothetical protein
MVALPCANYVNYFRIRVPSIGIPFAHVIIGAMNLSFFPDPDHAPRPREEIQLESLDLTPYPDGRRAKVDLTITPFMPMDRPSLEISVTDEDDNLVASLSVVETNTHVLSLTVHLKTIEQPKGQYTFQVDLYYDEHVQHSLHQSIRLPEDIPVTG